VIVAPPELAPAAIDTLASSTDLLQLLRASAELAEAASAAGPDPAIVDQVAPLIGVDRFAALAAIEALAGIGHPDADRVLLALLRHDDPILARHASWRLASSRPDRSSLTWLAHRLTMGGIDTMHAHRTLRHWARSRPGRVVAAVNELLPTVESAAARARVVDLLGVIDDPTADAALLMLAADRSEAPAARVAAVAALGHRRVTTAGGLLRSLARSDGDLALPAAQALDDLARPARPVVPDGGRGLRLAQLTLTGELDPDLSNGGRGDTGGVASLIVSLGEALARRPEVDRVVTIGRATTGVAPIGPAPAGAAALRYAGLAVGDDGRPWSSSEAWEHLPSIERELTRVLGRGCAVDLIHLRMADVGTLAAVGVAERLGIEVCFSLAPDPHGHIRALQSAGHLDRDSFVERDGREHLWFRARLVERLARRASRLALFPRRRGDDLVADLLGPRPPRAVVVPEGIEIDAIRRAEAGSARPRPGPRSPDRDILDDLAARIPAHRRHLPLLVSVGRLHPVKGMERVAAAWAADPDLHRSCTLVVVGGALVDPSSTERSVLAAIDEAVPELSPARAGLVLLGGRSRRDVARLLVAAVAGRPGAWGPGGVYVNGAHKEEFGLALIEALAAGLPVVAPANGGPPTFVDDGDTGVLVDAADDLGPAIRRAFLLVDRPGRAERARSLMEERYSIETMADQLIDLYRSSPAAMVAP
jgi:glycosyltransferase involved in cell wall biosynthesis